MLRVTVLGLAGLVISSSLAFADEAMCVQYPLEEPDENGEALFVVEFCPVSGGSADCFNCIGDTVLLDVNSVNWPQYCPDCYAPSRNTAAISRPLSNKIRVNQSLADYLPRSVSATNGRMLSIQPQIRQVTAHDIQVRPGSGGPTISVRLFEMAFTDTKGRSRLARFGLESARPVQAGIQPFLATMSESDDYKLAVTYRGRRYPVATQTPVRASDLATSP
ncbi:hypothetical protein Pan44_46150 [Caulifigura coniformis]|uniref:Uncharacterized protein n=1 Tax=Caulifigura coniformis TaxID=2527983 RepID=A0A517SKA9_9PLAN|nr:hypothetical protein [Caulifigura coniformis]QDT56559.1 hypothetical protein Pan44_46150 [Caulifigura coniformis]